MANTNEKITKTMKFDMLLAIDEVASNEMLVDFIEHEKELIRNKAKKGRQPSAKQVENETMVIPQIIEYLESVEKATATDIGANIGYSVPRVSAQLKKLVNDNKIARIVEKGRPFFKIV